MAIHEIDHDGQPITQDHRISIQQQQATPPSKAQSLIVSPGEPLIFLVYQQFYPGETVFDQLHTAIGGAIVYHPGLQREWFCPRSPLPSQRWENPTPIVPPIVPIAPIVPI